MRPHEQMRASAFSFRTGSFLWGESCAALAVGLAHTLEWRGVLIAREDELLHSVCQELMNLNLLITMHLASLIQAGNVAGFMRMARTMKLGLDEVT